MTPEAEELLREVAQDPRSTILRYPRAPISGRLYHDERSAARTQEDWTKAEEALVTVLRNEVAMRLRLLFRERLIRGRDTKDSVNPYRLGTQSPSNVRQMSKYRVMPVRNEELTRGLDILERAELSEPNGQLPSLAEIAKASLELQSTTAGRIQATIDLLFRGKIKHARSCLNALLRDTGGPCRPIARDWLAFSYSMSGQPEAAARCYMLAIREGSENPTSMMSAFANAADANSLSLLSSISRLLEYRLSPSHPAVLHFVASHKRRRELGVYKPTDAAMTLHRRKRLPLEPVSAKLSEIYVA